MSEDVSINQVAGQSGHASGAFYAVYFTGTSGSGFAVLGLAAGVVFGADATGGIYDGEYSTNDKGLIQGTVRLTVPPATLLVTGSTAGEHPHTMEFPISLPQGFDGDTPVELQLPTGPVNVLFKKIRDF